MKFEKLNYSSGNVKKAFVIGIVVTLLFIVVINLFLTRAKYQVTESIPLANGTINYTLVDFELAGIKIKGLNDNEYKDATTILDGNYVLNEENSYCTEKYVSEDNSFEDVKNTNLKIEFDNSNKTISVKPYSKKGTKCYLYLEEKPEPKLLNQTVIAQSTKKQGTFTGLSCSSGCTLSENGVYEAEDDYGTSYYYRGTVSNNWVVFGQDTTNNQYIWWRIIRINGNGTIRLIYAGTSNSKTSAPSTTGDETMIKPKTSTNNNSYPRAVYFNQTYNDNKYVGYMYPGQKGTASANFDGAHKVDKTSTKSDALTQIESWYNQDTNLGTLAAQYIDVDTGFCSDSSLAKGSHGSYTGQGYGTSQSGYAGLDRVWQQNSTSTNTSEQKPTLKCGYDVIGKQLNKEAQKRDLYTGPGATSGGTKGLSGNVEGNNALPVPVGLITMDEVIYAGGFYGKANANYWLKTDKYYWTMSPSFVNSNGYAQVFYVATNGSLNSTYVGYNNYGVRPVINLSADAMVTGSGIASDPYIVQTS